MSALVALLVAVAVVIPFVGIGDSGANEAVTDALNSTLAAGTVQLSFTATVTAAGTAVHLSGTGSVDLTNQAVQFHLSEAHAGQTVTVSAVAVDGKVYIQVPQLAQLDPGRSWLEVPTTGTGGSSIGSAGALGRAANAGNILSLLQKSGATVTTLGQSTIDGTAVQGYRATMDRAAIDAVIAGDNLPSSDRQAIGTLDLTSLSLGLYVDGSGRLRSVQVDVEAAPDGAAASVRATLDLSGYGQPVSIQPPPSTQVATFQQFAQSLPAGLTLL